MHARHAHRQGHRRATQTAPVLRDRLTEVRAARDFASRELGLAGQRQLSLLCGPQAAVRGVERRGGAGVLGATRSAGASRSPAAWPIAATSRKTRRGSSRTRWTKEGFDTYVGGVAAYSTLGKFKDPVLNTMLGYGDDELAAIIFHELSHQLIYVPNDSEFNEAFATAVEQAGLERWLKLRGRESDLGRLKARRERQAQIIALFIGAPHQARGALQDEARARGDARPQARNLRLARRADRGSREAAGRSLELSEHARRASTTLISRRLPRTTTAFRASSDCSREQKRRPAAVLRCRARADEKVTRGAAPALVPRRRRPSPRRRATIPVELALQGVVTEVAGHHGFHA